VEFNGAISYPEFVIDTGFTGDLKIDLKTAAELGIEYEKLDVTSIGNANGQLIPAGFTNGFSELQNRKKSIEIIVADGPHLLGINFLATFGYKAVVDCKNWECYLEAA
jgi:predicted aspartyl protease